LTKSNFIVRGGADFSGITKAMNKTQGQLKSFQSGIAKSMKMVVVALSTIAIGSLIKDSTKMAMGVESAMDNISRNMGNSAMAFNNWAQTQSKALGMARADAYKYGSTFSNLLGSFSTSSEQTASETKKLMQAAAVISSKTGRTYEDTANRIRSGMLGSTEAIEDLGIYTQVSMLESTESFKKFANGKSWAQLDFQLQQQIRLAAILEQSYKRYGDTLADTTQTRQAQFLASLKNIQLNLGQAFLPIYNVVLPALTALGNKIEAVTSIFSQFTQALFGKATVTAVKETEDQADAMTGLGDSTEKAGKQAKGALAGFDEINALSDNSGGSGSSMGVTPTVTTTEQEAIGNDITVSPKIQQMVDGFKTMFEPVTTALENLKTASEPLINTISDALKSFYDNVLVPFGNWAIGDALPAFLNLLAGALKVLNPLVESFKPLVKFLWDEFLKPIASWTGGVIVAVIEELAGALTRVGDWMSKNKPIIEGVTTATVAFFIAWKLAEVMAFIQMSGGLIKAIKGITLAIKAGTLAKIADKFETVALTLMYAKDFVASILAGTAALLKQGAQWIIHTALVVAETIAQWAMIAATAAWNIVCGIATGLTWAFGAAVAFLTSPIGLVILAITAVIAIVVLLVKHWDEVKAAGVEAWTDIKLGWSEAATWFDATIIQPVKLAFSTFWSWLSSVGATTWMNIKTTWSVVTTWFKTSITTPLTTTFDTFWTGINTSASTTWTGIKSVWSSVKNWFDTTVIAPIKTSFTGLWNSIIDGMNTVIKGLNKIKIDIPDWVPGFGGEAWGIKIPTIPKLAKGGITNGPMLATIGDNPGGREVVSPLDDLVGIIKSALTEALLNTNTNSNSNNNYSGPDTLILKVGETELGRVAIKSINTVQRQTGIRLITV